MRKKILIFVLAGVGLATFFLPLVRIQAPLVGTQKISGWDAVKPEEEKRGRGDLGLSESLEKMQESFIQGTRREAPLAVRQAEALVVTLPLAYVSFLLAGVFAARARTRPLQVTAAVGWLAGAYSLASVCWLNSGVRQMVGGGGSRLPGMDWLRGKVAERVSVNPEVGLYLLVGALTALLLASFLPAGKR